MKILAFDMDNTLCKTSESVINLFVKFCEINKLVKELEYIEENINKIPVCKFDKEISKLIYEGVISKRVYMDIARPTDLFGVNNELVKLIRGIREEVKDIKVVITTHRGDNINAWMSTYNWLNKHDAVNEFDMIHSINHVVNKDKIEYLKDFYKTDKILLVDDNPFGSTSVIRERCKQVLIYNGIDKFNSHENQLIFKERNDILNLMKVM